MGELHEVVLIAEAAALPGKRDELRRAFEELVPRALAEAGVRTFRLHEDRDQSGRFMLYERYHDQDAVDVGALGHRVLPTARAMTQVVLGELQLALQAAQHQVVEALE